MRNANENELPEERYRVLVERKRNELTHLMHAFRNENESAQIIMNKDYEDNRHSIYPTRRNAFHSSACRDQRSNTEHAHSSVWDHGPFDA